MAKSEKTQDVTKDLSDADIAKLRAEAEQKAKSSDVDHAYCPVTGLKFVTKTGLVPLKFKQGIPEMSPGVNAGEIAGVAPAHAKHLVSKGYAEYVLPDPVQQ